MAYEKGCSIWEARDELDKLRVTIETIQAVLLDAEKKQDGSAAVRNWIKRVKGVLYDADDLFDEVATDDMLKQQMKGNKHLKKVRVSCSKLNPIVSRNSIAKKVTAIRKSLLEISTDMAQFDFVRCEREGEIFTGLRTGQDPGSFVDSKHVVGRDKDKKAILKRLLHNARSKDVEQDVSVIAIVGIGGMGKTTLAQLIYNDKEVQKSFEKKWFACISNTSDEKEVIGKIFQSISGDKYNDFTVSQLQSRIRESVSSLKNFLLVLDDVWDEDHGRWQDRLSLLSSGAKGCKIIVTTRSLLVARAMDAVKTHKLDGLSEDESWALFKRVAFTGEQEKDPRWSNLGREIVKKCANVPLAIKSIGRLLHGKTTIQEWESIRNEEIAMLGESGQVPVMSVLKLSYDHLHSNLKQCFAYCSLFPKDYIIQKETLIHLWIAQGYIQPNNEKQTFEEAGNSYFMDLVRRSFFQVEDFFDGDNVSSCKMHDLIHDLAQYVAGEESITVTTSSKNIIGTRHASFGCVTIESWDIPAPLFTINRLRSLLFIGEDSFWGLDLDDQHVANLKFLRTLSLPCLKIENVPSSIGQLKHLRYLDISGNHFENLPDSITKLLNLWMLNIRDCGDLETLPNDLRRLINLRHFYIEDCDRLKQMPPGFGELACLQHLDEFKVGRGMDRGRQRSDLGELTGLGLRGTLKICFTDDTDDWDGVDCWQPPVNLERLEIIKYQGMRIPHWADGRSENLPNITCLCLCDCSRVKCLPPLRHLPSLKSLHLRDLNELEYIQEASASSNALFLPCLEDLDLSQLPKLKGWSTQMEAAVRSKDSAAADQEEHNSSTCACDSPQLSSFPCLSTLMISDCPKLESMPLCPRLDYLTFMSGNAKVIPQLLSIHDCSSSSSSLLRYVAITHTDELTSFPGKSLTSLRSLTIRHCKKLKRVDLPPSHLNILQYLSLAGCPELELWEQDNRGVDWDSLPNLRVLDVGRIPSPERLPNCLRYRLALGHLKLRL